MATPRVGWSTASGPTVLLHGLISDLLDYAKVEAGKMEMHPEPVAVQALLDGVADRFRPLTARKGLALDTVYADAPPSVVTDRQRVEQILTNLVGNAVKFTERGGITLEARLADDAAGFTPLATGEVVVPTGPGLLILVRDTGIGIREEDVARLAADFEQLDAEAAAKYGGTGLGLSISRRLAQRLGGLDRRPHPVRRRLDVRALPAARGVTRSAVLRLYGPRCRAEPTRGAAGRAPCGTTWWR